MSAAAGSSDLKETSSRDVAIVRTKITTERRGLNLPGTVTRTGWQPPPDLNYEDWIACGATLREIEGSVSW
jgi:hypothetical protein